MAIKSNQQLITEGLMIQPLQWILLESIVLDRLCDAPVQFIRQSGSRVYYREWYKGERAFGPERFAQRRTVRYVADTQAEADEFYTFSRDREDALMYAEKRTKFEWGRLAQKRFGIPNQFTKPEPVSK